MENQTDTTGRIYWTAVWDNLWFAYWQPKNPKTGQPWQAVRSICKGKDAYQLSNHRTSTVQAPVIGPAPAFELWAAMGATGLTRGFSSEALALAAIADEKRRSGK